MAASSMNTTQVTEMGPQGYCEFVLNALSAARRVARGFPKHLVLSAWTSKLAITLCRRRRWSRGVPDGCLRDHDQAEVALSAGARYLWKA